MDVNQLGLKVPMIIFFIALDFNHLWALTIMPNCQKLYIGIWCTWSTKNSNRYMGHLYLTHLAVSKVYPLPFPHFGIYYYTDDCKVQTSGIQADWHRVSNVDGKST